MFKNVHLGGFRFVFSALGIFLLIGIALGYTTDESARQNGNNTPQTDQAISFESNNWLGLIWHNVTGAENDVFPFSGQLGKTRSNTDTGTLQKMIVDSGRSTMEIDLDQLNGLKSRSRTSTLRFDVVRNSFFMILVMNDELRGPLPSSMELIPQGTAQLPAKLSASYNNLVIESPEWGEGYDLVIRDGKSGFLFFNIEGQEFNYDPTERQLTVKGARLLLSDEFARELGRPSQAGTVVGEFSFNTTMRAIEISNLVYGDVKSVEMPSLADAGTRPGPDVIVGDVSGLAQFGSPSGSRVGLALGTDSCNAGVVNLNWFSLPNNDHPVIPQNLYRMSGGATNDATFEQVGQSNLKHAFTALTNNICGFGCNGVGGSQLGSGCSDPYSASLNASQSGLGSRAWVNPFTGAYPRGDSGTSPNTHSGHTHNGTSHRILVEMNDLNTTMNAGATYYAEGQYVTPHEYAWCQANPTQCNMNNNVSYRRYNVSGIESPFSFSPVGSTIREKAAIEAWTGATLKTFRPDPVADGVAIIGYKITNPSIGVWHYEYAIYNQNLDRAIESFGIGVGVGVNISNVGFHAPPQQPGWLADGTDGNGGFSNTPWTQSQAGGFMTWSSESFGQNPNANAVRWGTMYNIRFDSDRPPVLTNAKVKYFKTGTTQLVTVQGPGSVNQTCSRIPQGNRC